MKKIMLFIFFLLTTNLFAADDNSFNPLPLYIVGLFIAVGIIILLIILLIKINKKPEDSDAYKTLKTQLDELNKNHNQLLGETKQVQVQNSQLIAQKDSLSQEKSNLEKKVSEFEAKEGQRIKDSEKHVENLENSRKALENERDRVIADEKAAKEQEKENRTRIWALHEDNAKTVMREICQKSDISLSTFDNTNPPEGFDTKLKPDFMVQLLKQFVIFDSKTSQSQSLETYLKNQVQSTAKKIRSSDSYNDIYKSIFFVIPGIALPEIKTTHYIEQGLSFYVIPLESFEPIIRTLKRLEDYELADKYDPQERENIVNVLAAYDQHIRQQNATNILTAIRGLKVMKEKETMPDDVVQAVEAKRQKIRFEQLSPALLKKFIENPANQAEEIVALIAPKQPEIDKQDLNDVSSLVNTD